MSIYADEFRRLLTDLEPDVPSATCYEAASKWVELAKNPNYHVAEQCKAALDALLVSKSWFDLLASKQPVDCVIDLGAGAGDKLALIASCLPTVTLIPLDVSLDMLLWAYGTLRSHQEGAATSAVIRPVRVDLSSIWRG